MALLKRTFLTVALAASVVAYVPVSVAGKVENATAAEVKEAIDSAVSLSEETLAAVNSDADKDAVLDLYKATKQASKRIESNVVDRLRAKANSFLGNSRNAFKKGNKAEAVELLEKAVETYKGVKTKYGAF